MIVTVWSTAIAGSELIGGVLRDTFGAASLPWALVILLTVTLTVAWSARAHGFPVNARRQTC